MRPLPRSLDPLPGESLPGFLLRLSYRLGIAPLHVAARCGLGGRPQRAAPSAFPSRYLLHVDPGLAETAAGSLRLTASEIHHLTLVRQAPGFSPVQSDYLGKKPSISSVVHEGWIFTRFSRYCPECLAERAGHAFGSAWYGRWRLPFVFTCPLHRRFLEWCCPACGNPAFSAGINEAGRWRAAQLIPNPLVVLHPAQCRSRSTENGQVGPRAAPTCGHRLDVHNGPAPVPSAEVTDLEDRLSRLATASVTAPAMSLGKPTTASVFFNDLRTTMLLICATWPVAAELKPSMLQLDADALRIEDQLRSVSVRQENGRFVVPVPALGAPSPDPVVAAGLMGLASNILGAPQAADHLDSLLAHCTKQWSGRAKLLELEPHCSNGFRAAVKGRLNGLRPGSDSRVIFPQTPTRGDRLEARRIPLRLPDTWFTLLEGLGAPLGALRRDAAIRLVEMAGGSTRRAAALYLGFRDSTVLSTASRLRTWQHNDDNAEKYSRALALLADEIIADPHGVDYQLRREQLRTWVIPPDEWATIIEKVAQRQSPTVRSLTCWSPRRHLAASAVVWARATQGYFWLAPMVQHYRLPDPQLNAAKAEAGHIGRPGPNDGEGSIRRLLNETLWDYCSDLTAHLDAGLSATDASRSKPGGQHGTWNPPGKTAVTDAVE
ncbi:TniQ family protein [Streptomyces canus]|uniref:TniQ family protein n=1 Tax=Streptomyces TaxID=1883 RepID=UPI0030DE80FA